MSRKTKYFAKKWKKCYVSEFKNVFSNFKFGNNSDCIDVN